MDPFIIEITILFQFVIEDSKRLKESKPQFKSPTPSFH